MKNMSNNGCGISIDYKKEIKRWNRICYLNILV
jgi:hypothetical protein